MLSVIIIPLKSLTLSVKCSRSATETGGIYRSGHKRFGYASPPVPG